MGKNLKNATKKAIKQSKFDVLDYFGAGEDEFDYIEDADGIPTVAKNAAKGFIERVRENIKAADSDVTGKISDISIVPTANGFNIEAYPHLIYQDLGVNGAKNKRFNTPFSYKDKQPPVDEIKEWIKAKGLRTGNTSGRGKTDMVESAAWAISRNIYNEGQEPKNIYSKEIPEFVEDITNAISNVAVYQILKGLDLTTKL